MLTYNKYRPKAQTGDMIAFSGTGLASTGIKVASGSEWSHIGMGIVSPEWDMVLCHESTLLCTVADIGSGFVKKGVMLVPLQARIATYKGKMGIRCIRNPLTLEQLAILRAYRHEVKDRPYENDYIELVKAVYDGPFGENTQDLISLFCSENFAEPCIRMKLIGDDEPSNEYHPGDFIDDGNFDEIWEPVQEIIVGT